MNSDIVPGSLIKFSFVREGSPLNNITALYLGLRGMIMGDDVYTAHPLVLVSGVNVPLLINNDDMNYANIIRS